MRLSQLGNSLMGRKAVLCDTGLLLGDDAYYLHAASETVTSEVMREGAMALGEATAFFMETMEKAPARSRIVRCGIDTSAVPVEAKPLIAFDKSLRNLLVNRRGRVRDGLGFGPGVQFGYSKPRKSRQGIIGYVASESRGNLRQFRERLLESRARAAGVWPWFAILRSLGSVLGVGGDFAAVTIAESFAAYAEFSGGELLIYENHHYSRDDGSRMERTRAWQTIEEKVNERMGSGDAGSLRPLILATPSSSWAMAESTEWSTLASRANVTVAELSDLLKATAALPAGGTENMLYTASDDVGLYVGVACKVGVSALMLMSLFWFCRSWYEAHQTTKDLPAFQTTFNGYQRRLQAGEARKAEIERIEGGILDPTSQNAAGASLLLEKLADAMDKVDNAMLLSVHVENKAWHIEWLLEPSYRGKDVLLAQQQQQRRQAAIDTVLASLKSAGFVGERVTAAGEDLSRWRNKGNVIVCVGTMP